MSELPIRYIGRHDSYRDRAFKTGATWAKGEVKMVPEHIAKRMAKQIDAFEIAEDADVDGAESTGVLPPRSDEEKADNLIEETRFQLEQMDRKEAITEFIKTQWDIDTDKKGKTLKDLREIANMHIDNLGLIGND